MKRRKKSVPLLLFWSKREQARFIQGVERFHGILGDLQTLLVELKTVVQLKARPRPARREPVLGSADQATIVTSPPT